MLTLALRVFSSPAPPPLKRTKPRERTLTASALSGSFPLFLKLKVNSWLGEQGPICKHLLAYPHPDSRTPSSHSCNTTRVLPSSRPSHLWAPLPPVGQWDPLSLSHLLKCPFFREPSLPTLHLSAPRLCVSPSRRKVLGWISLVPGREALCGSIAVGLVWHTSRTR